MSMDYIRRTYGLPVRRGSRVQDPDTGRLGTVTYATLYLHVRWDGLRRSIIVHPRHVTLLPEDA